MNSKRCNKITIWLVGYLVTFDDFNLISSSWKPISKLVDKVNWYFFDDDNLNLLHFSCCLPLEFVLRGFAVCSYQRPLYWQKTKDGWSTMSDGIFDGMFLIVHRTFLVSYFRGCWLLDCVFFFVLKACGHIIERLSSCAVAVFIKQLQQHGHAKLNFWRSKVMEFG